MGSHVVLLCSDLGQTSRTAVTSECVNARRAPACPRLLRPSAPNGLPAAIQPTPLVRGCRVRRAARHGRLSFARLAAKYILCGYRLVLTGCGLCLRLRL